MWLVGISTGLLVFGAFDWLGFAGVLIVVYAWWSTTEED